MPQQLFLAPAAARSWLAERDISTVFDSGATVERTNNKRDFFAIGGGPVAGQLGVGESLHDDPVAVFDDADPPVQTGWNATVLFDETVPVMRGGIAEIEVRTPAFRRFAVYLIDSSAATLTAINAALQAHKLYYGEVTAGILTAGPAGVATRDELATDAATWRDAATAAGEDTLAAHIDTFRTNVLAMQDRVDFLREMRFALGITQADIDRVQIGQVEEA